MREEALRELGDWLVEGGLLGTSELDLLTGFCRRGRELGLPLGRALMLCDTLHPVHEGRVYAWHRLREADCFARDYGRTNEGEALAQWQRSTFYELLTTGGTERRCRLVSDDLQDRRGLAELKDDGQTDYLAMIHRFATGGAIGEMDCVYSYWTSDAADGFGDADLAALRRLVPPLALAVKSAALARIATNLVETYLGRDAGRRVLKGKIVRGVAEKIEAVLWFSDLRGYTTITDTAPPEEIIPLLNDYADAVISSIHAAGGDVLKLIGDGTLAIFKARHAADACAAALRAEAGLRSRMTLLDERRQAEGRPVTSVYLGLHIGEVFYGNIGSEDRLDFTVVGPAVNEVSRIASMCRSVDRGVLISADFFAATPQELQADLVSVGRFALRGVGRSRDLFTIDPTLLSET